MSCSAASLKLHLASKSENYRALRSSADIRVILNDRLQEEHRRRVQKRVEFDAILRLERRHAGLNELLAQLVAHIPERHGVVKADRKRLVKAQPGSEDPVVAVHVRRAPIVGNGCVQSSGPFRVYTPNRLARHPVQQVVPSPWYRA